MGRLAFASVVLWAFAAAASPNEAWSTSPFGVGVGSSPHVRRLGAADHEELLRALAGEERAFVFFSAPHCVVGELAWPAFASVASIYGAHARFLEAHFAIPAEESSPEVLYVEKGRILQSLRGVAWADRRGSAQLRIKQAYEGFVVSNLFGFEVARDFRATAPAQGIEYRHEPWFYGFEFDAPVVLRDAELTGMVSQNSDFSRADFRGANLRGARLWHSDFLRARFDGAKLEWVDWSGSRCPDGHVVLDRADSCLDHLKPPPKQGPVRTGPDAWHHAWHAKPWGEGSDPSPHVRIVEAGSREEALRVLADEEHVFAFYSTPTCGAGEVAWGPFKALALQYGEHASFVDLRYPPVRGEDTSPMLFYVRRGHVAQRLWGLSYVNGAGAARVRTKLAYEGFVVSNLFGIEAARDFRMWSRPDPFAVLEHGWFYGFEFRAPPDFRGRDLRTLISQNSDLSFADLRGADLRGAKLWHTDLTGARFDDARLDGVDWLGSICPDGHLVATPGDSCEDHLDVDIVVLEPADG